jgi:hypothetical protein
MCTTLDVLVEKSDGIQIITLKLYQDVLGVGGDHQG